MNVVVRTTADPRQLVQVLSREVLKLDPAQPARSVVSMDQLISRSLAPDRFSMFLLGGLAAMALVLATVGIYGIMAYTVSQRTHEIGIRMALGARPRDVLRLVVGQGMRLTAIGVVLGLAAAIALTRVMASLLFGVSATDAATFGGIAFLITGVAFLACYLPARGASRVDAMVALRHE
jgi:putative ABC transport system permease protein